MRSPRAAVRSRRRRAVPCEVGEGTRTRRATSAQAREPQSQDPRHPRRPAARMGEKAAQPRYSQRALTAQRTPQPRRAGSARGPRRTTPDRTRRDLRARRATRRAARAVGRRALPQRRSPGRAMIAERRVLPLEGGRMTTLALRAKEQAIERRITRLAQPAGRDVGDRARTARRRPARRAHRRTSKRRAGPRTPNRHRPRARGGPRRPGRHRQGSGDRRCRPRRASHRTPDAGIAVSGSTAQRLGQDSPALAGQTLTLDALVARVEHGRLAPDTNTTIFFDEAGMADTDRLHRLTRCRRADGREAGDDRRRRAAPVDRRGRHVRPAHEHRPDRSAVERRDAHSSGMSSAPGRTCVQDAQTGRWRTTSTEASCT